ncbi:hypothetical protein [Baekduia sp. Peel2402]|uniref:hypothetical protein n=1 Tax=Baekduia sp. Peel2402 TaxID=3458296 RepID=UPI00403EC6D8
MTSFSPPHLAGVTLRAARPNDAPDVARLAALDSRRVPSGPLLLAEENGILRAALSTTSGATVADPFAPTEHLIALLRRHASRRDAPPRWPTPGRSRLPRLALRAG